MKQNTIVALLKAAEKGNGYDFEVRKVTVSSGIVYIQVDNPLRTVKMTKETYSKIRSHIKERRIRK